MREATNCSMFEIIKRIIASAVNHERNMSWREKKLRTGEMIIRAIDKTIRVNETREVSIESMKNMPMKIIISFTGFMKRHKVRCTAILPKVTTITMLNAKIIRMVDEDDIPHTNMEIQTNENIKARIAVLGSINSLCSSVNVCFQDGG